MSIGKTALVIGCVASLLVCLGCSRRGMSVGRFSAYFQDPADARKIAMGVPIPISYKGNDIEIIPQHRAGTQDQVVTFSVTVQHRGRWDLKENHEFRALVFPYITPTPDEIYGVHIPGLAYSQRTFSRQESLQEFWDYLWSRPHLSYSIEEIRQLLPEEQAHQLDGNVTSRQTFVLDWPHDERSLSLRFTYDPDKGAVLLQGYGLDYPNGMNRENTQEADDSP